MEIKSKQYGSLNDAFEYGDVQIWYAKPDAPFGLKFGLASAKVGNCVPDINDLSKSHILLGSISMGERSMEDVFTSFQGECWSPYGEARELIRSRGLGHTSMSVGDLIVRDGKVLMVDSRGFTELGDV